MNDAVTFSIVIPVYNRAAIVRRAVASCLRQRHDSFEVIVVDDASTDDTAASIEQIADPRVRLLRQPLNRGPCPARNLAADHALGDWIVCLDSDDELTDNALAVMDAEIRSLPNDVHGVRFMCRLDDGALSPDPPLQREVWDFVAYLRWAEASLYRRQETLPCVRRETFETVRYPQGHGSLEGLYHMDFAARFVTATSPAVVRQYHSDAGNQITRPDISRAIAAAPDYARSYQRVLDRHGDALARWAPGVRAQYTRGLATQQFLAADRMAGARTVARLLRAYGPSVGALAVLTLGLAGPRPLAWVQAGRARRRGLAVT